MMQNSGSSSKGLLRPDDEVWMRGILDLIPKSVFGDIPTSSTLHESSKKEPKTRAKQAETEQNGRAKKTRTTRSDKRTNDNQDSKRDALQRKLQEKILEKRVARKADDESRIEARLSKKRKRDEKSKATARERKKFRSKKDMSNGKATSAETDLQDVVHSDKRKRELEEPEEDANITAIETTRLDGFNSEQRVRKAKRRKLRGGKLLELQRKLEEANKEKSMNETHSKTSGKREDDGNGEEHDSKQREMEKALQRVQGTNIKDDVKKLKKSIRREKRKVEKSREDWEKRSKTQEMELKAKQEKKVRNLEERKSARKSTGKSQGTVGKKR